MPHWMGGLPHRRVLARRTMTPGWLSAAFTLPAAASAAAADHFLIGKLTVSAGISANKARTAKNTTPATTAM
jgi:hypothetical protein